MNDFLINLPSFAKINLSLRVLGRRPDGYHEIDTVLQTVSVHDDLIFRSRTDDLVVLKCDAPEIPTDNTNLIMRAALALRESGKDLPGVDITLIKRIPAKGGLGGGSSNAAVTLLALKHLWQIDLDKKKFLSIASSLGSDVPFFLVGGLAHGVGTGKEVFPLQDSEKKWLIIITPKASVSTRFAYEALKSPSLTTSGSISILSSSFAAPFSEDSDQWALQNDFEKVIFEIEPEIERAKLALLETGAKGGLLTGSGSSVFGIFPSEDSRERARANLKCEDGWRTFACNTISREEYFKSLSLFGFPLLSSLNFQTDTGA
jgi:4-diphosphocytidyl-2-C-methyl-D-erythritol kinase